MQSSPSDENDGPRAPASASEAGKRRFESRILSRGTRAIDWAEWLKLRRRRRTKVDNGYDFFFDLTKILSEQYHTGSC
jgi:hypothetical protein